MTTEASLVVRPNGRFWKVFFKGKLLFFSQVEDSSMKFACWFARKNGNLPVIRIADESEEAVAASSWN